jgi:hypothetical protein
MKCRQEGTRREWIGGGLDWLRESVERRESESEERRESESEERREWIGGGLDWFREG